MNRLLEVRLAGIRWSRLTAWFFRAVAYSLNLSICIYVESNEIDAPLTLDGCFVKILLLFRLVM